MVEELASISRFCQTFRCCATFDQRIRRLHAIGWKQGKRGSAAPDGGSVARSGAALPNVAFGAIGLPSLVLCSRSIHRTAVYGSVRMVVWAGRRRKASPVVRPNAWCGSDVF
jgi:hypothetical protein